ncbi:MAG TPA: aldehyde dehydrogenase family protein [Microthrixaceae bacterium]|nr:aldehyde dehydrogenase family protein [Microthrixaceae bacterium]
MTNLESTPSTTAATPSFTELVDGVRATFNSGRTRPMTWRRRQLEGMLQMLKVHEQDFVDAIVSDLGRPVLEAFSADIGHARLQIKHVLKHFEQWARTEKVSPGLLSQPGTAEIIKEPLGVALVIAPWNYPVQLLLEPMAAALAAGNAVVAKPSELAPASAAVLARLIPQYLDDDAVVVVEGGVPETTALLEEPFDHIFFTGSTNVGRVVMTAAAKHLTPVTLELGGKSPTIVAADADLAIAAKRIVWAKLMNAGQTCIAPDYVLVDETVKDRFVDLVVDAIRTFVGADPKQSSDLGRIISPRHLDRLVGLVSGGGGTTVVGGDHDQATKYLAPTVIVDPDLESNLMTEEIFGPVLPIVSVVSVDEAIEFVNARPKPLALYVFTQSSTTADLLLRRTSSGGACVNHAVVHILPDGLPLGGVGPSGMGAYHGRTGFDAFSHHKSVVRKKTRPDMPLLYAPYGGWKERIVRFVFR